MNKTHKNQRFVKRKRTSEQGLIAGKKNQLAMTN